jgi:hypothetical protein
MKGFALLVLIVASISPVAARPVTCNVGPITEKWDGLQWGAVYYGDLKEVDLVTFPVGNKVVWQIDCKRETGETIAQTNQCHFAPGTPTTTHMIASMKYEVCKPSKGSIINTKECVVECD